MYNIIQLNDKNLSELQQIAKELGLKKVDSLKKEELVYRILDEQAIVGATKKVAAQQNNEERKEGQPRKRSRISIKKEGDKVYTATKDKAQKLEANTPALPAPTPLFKEIPALPEQTETVAPVTEKTAQPEVAAAPATEEKPKAKRGRKPGSKNKSTLAKEAQEAAEKWNVSLRWVQRLCKGNRIEGVMNINRVWLIPKNAEKPADARKKLMKN